MVVGLILAASAIGLALDRRSADATPKAETGAAQPAAKQPDAEAAAATAAAAEAERATESHRAKKACDSCHTAPAEHYPGKCTSCHSPERPFEQPQLSHVTFGAHTQATQACATCHAAEPTSEITCRACHGNDCSKNAKTVGDCLKCHKKGSTKTWVPKPES